MVEFNRVSTRLVPPIRPPTMTITRTKRELSKAVMVELGKHNFIRPGLSHINKLNFDLINAYITKYESAWVGVVTPVEEELDNPFVWEIFSTEFIRPHSCNFVLPCYDEELNNLIATRIGMPYRGKDRDGKMVDGIFARVAELEGSLLMWS